MPGRRIKIVTGNVYHVFNRGVAKMPTYKDIREYRHFVELIDYYRYANTTLRYSKLLQLSPVIQRQYIHNLKKTDKKNVEILAFVLMPNHFHFILKQLLDGGIATFMSDVCNSYTKYVNTKQDRVGPLFQGKFKAIDVKTDAQLMHLSRYIHLNPYTDGVVKSLHDLFTFPYSSLSAYCTSDNYEFVSTKTILSLFNGKKSYQLFVKKQTDYQKNLKLIRKLLLE